MSPILPHALYPFHGKSDRWNVIHDKWLVTRETWTYWPSLHRNPTVLKWFHAWHVERDALNVKTWLLWLGSLTGLSTYVSVQTSWLIFGNNCSHRSYSTSNILRSARFILYITAVNYNLTPFLNSQNLNNSHGVADGCVWFGNLNKVVAKV